MGPYDAFSSHRQDYPPHLSSTYLLPLDSNHSQREDDQQRSGHHVWSSSPPATDDYDYYCYQSSPSSGSAPMSCYDPLPTPPRTWSSPDFPLSQTWESLHQQSQQNPFAGGCLNQRFNDEIDGIPHNYSPATIPSLSVTAFSYTSSLGEPLLSTPMNMETGEKSRAGEPDCRASTDEQLDAKEGKGVVGAKTEESYARLLYRALMSAPGHAMTLQEIYQWFRENTDKDVKRETHSQGQAKTPKVGKLASATT